MQNPHSTILEARLRAKITGTGGTITPSLPSFKLNPQLLPAPAVYGNGHARLALLRTNDPGRSAQHDHSTTTAVRPPNMTCKTRINTVHRNNPAQITGPSQHNTQTQHSTIHRLDSTTHRPDTAQLTASADPQMSLSLPPLSCHFKLFPI